MFQYLAPRLISRICENVVSKKIMFLNYYHNKVALFFIRGQTVITVLSNIATSECQLHSIYVKIMYRVIQCQVVQF